MVLTVWGPGVVVLEGLMWVSQHEAEHEVSSLGQYID